MGHRSNSRTKLSAVLETWRISARARAKEEGVTFGRPVLEDSDAVKFAAVEAAFAERKASAGLRVSSGPASARYCALRPSWHLDPLVIEPLCRSKDPQLDECSVTAGEMVIIGSVFRWPATAARRPRRIGELMLPLERT